MGIVPSASVHLAVLAIAKDPARPDLAAIDAVAVRAAAAGHRVMARQAVSDTEAAIRSQLARWFDDKEIDVVIVLSGDSAVIAPTLAPLVTHVLPGMGSAQAAQCGTTLVFVVPAGIPAAMDGLILPQLDAATTPRNLLGLLPRLQAKPAPSADGVPQAVPVEKTAGGSGLPARLPAEMRPKPRTGANVISRGRPPVDDPPTKPIDVARLERQIAKSNTPSHDDVTRPAIALGLPPLPPGAVEDTADLDEDLDSDDDHTATDTVAVQPAPPLPPAGPRSRPTTAPPRTPLPSVVKPSARPSSTAAPTGGVPAASREAKPFSFSTPVRGGAPGSAPPPMRSAGTAAPPRESTTTGTVAYPARDAKSPSIRSSPPPPPRPREPTSSGTPAYPARDPKSGGIRTVPPPPPPAAVTPPREPTASGTPAYPARPSSGTSPPPVPTREPFAAQTSSGTPAFPAKAPPPLPSDAKVAPDLVEELPTEESWTSTLVAAKADADAKDDAKLLADAKAAADARDAAAAKLVAEARDVVARAHAVAQAEADARDAADAKLLADAKAAAEARDAAEQADADARLLADARAAAAARDEAEQAEADAKLLADAKAAADARDAAAANAKPSVEAARTRQATPPTPVAPPTDPARFPQATPPAALPIAARVRQPTPPPPLPVVSAATEDDLPRGAFSYPVQPRKSNLVIKVGAAAALTVLGFFAVVYFLDRDKTTSTKVATATPPVPADAPSADAAAIDSAVTASGSATTEPEIEMDTGDPPPPTGSAGKGSAAKGSTTPPTGPRPRPVPPTPRPPTGSATPPATGSAVAPPPPDEPDVADLCDEANCVLSEYDRPCCEKYKPKGPVLSQRVGGVPQTLDRSMVKAGVDGIKPRVIACGEKSGVKGTVKIAVVVSTEGAVTSADVQDSPDTALGSCVAGALRAAKFKKSVEGGSFTYPFVF